MENKIKFVVNINEVNTTIIGTTQSGKTTLGKQLEELGFYYLSANNLKELQFDIDKIKTFLNIDSYLETTDRQSLVLANIIELINNGIKKIVFDDILTYVDFNVRKQLLKTLISQGIRIVNITMDIEDTLFTDYLIVMFNKQVALEGQTLEVLKEEKLLKRMGLSLPFMIDLSIQLQYYGLVDKIYLDKEELVSELWK